MMLVQKNVFLAALVSVMLPFIVPVFVEILFKKAVATPEDADFMVAMKAAQKDVEEYLAGTPSARSDIAAFFTTPESPRSSKEVFPGDLLSFYRKKRLLVVGGSKGIGRGIALQAAALGADAVHIVGSSDAGQKTLEQMRIESSAEKSTDKYQFFKANLFSVDRCESLVAQDLKSATAGRPYDLVVFTVGQWPDLQSGQPLTPSGYEKGVFLAVIARYAIFSALHRHKLLTDTAVMMNVLASAQDTPPAFFLPGGSDDTFRGVHVPALLQKQDPLTFTPQLAGTLMVEMHASDAMLLGLAKENPQMTFIGTMPGIIATDVGKTALGEWPQRLLFLLARLLGVTISERRCGLQHLAIVRGVSVLKESKGRKSDSRNWSFWDHYVIARGLPRLLEGAAGHNFVKEVSARLEGVIAQSK